MSLTHSALMKGLKGNGIVLGIGIVIFLVSGFFIFMIFDTMIGSDLLCMMRGGSCDIDVYTLSTGLFIVMGLIGMICMAFYVMLNSLRTEWEAGIKEQAKQAL